MAAKGICIISSHALKKINMVCIKHTFNHKTTIKQLRTFTKDPIITHFYEMNNHSNNDVETVGDNIIQITKKFQYKDMNKYFHYDNNEVNIEWYTQIISFVLNFLKASYTLHYFVGQLSNIKNHDAFNASIKFNHNIQQKLFNKFNVQNNKNDDKKKIYYEYKKGKSFNFPKNNKKINSTRTENIFDPYMK